MVIFKTGPIMLLFLLFSVAGWAQKTWEGNLAELIESENNFARMASETSIKGSFLAYLDSSGVVFNGGVPGNGIALYTKQKEGKDLLTWYPVVGQVSLEGDMGFTSGPYEYAFGRGQAAVGSGYFFSLWKRNTSGVFKVILDAGLQHSNDSTNVFARNPRPEKAGEYGKPFATRNEKEELPWELEAAFAKLAEKDPVSAYRRFLGENSLVLRADQKIGRIKNENLKLIEITKPGSCSYKPLGKGISAAKDFAYCYGEIKQTYAGKEQSGFYVRVWQFQKDGWKITADQLVL